MFLSAAILLLVFESYLLDHLVNRNVLLVFRKALNRCIGCLLEILLGVLTSVHPLVMLENFLREALDNPRVLQSFQGCHPVYRVPDETLIEEVKEQRIRSLKDTGQSLRVGLPHFASAVGRENRITALFEEEMASARKFDHAAVRHAVNFHDICKLLDLIFSREQWIACEKFSDNCSKRPHVDCAGVWNSKNDLRSPVESRLDICVDTLPNKTA